MGETSHKKEFPAEFARAGEARQFIAWTGAVAGLRGGALSDLAVAAEAVLTDIFLSGEKAGEGGMLEVESVSDGDALTVSIRHPKLENRRMAGLENIAGRFLDGHELSPTRAVLVKRLRPPG